MLGFDWSSRSAISIFSKVLVISVVLLLAGCVKPRKFPRYLTVADVVNNVKCQLYGAVLYQTQSKTYSDGTSSFAASGHWLTGWATEFSLELDVVRKGELSGDTSFVTPYTLGTFTNKVSASLSKQATSHLTLDFNAEDNLVSFMSKDRCAFYREHRRSRNLAGETGLSLWFGKVIEGIDNANISTSTSKFVYSIDFVLSAEGSFIPSYSFTYPSLRKLFGMAAFSKSRVDTNTLSVTFTPYVAPKDDPDKLDTELKALLEIVKVLGAQGTINNDNLNKLISLASKGRPPFAGPPAQIQGFLDKDKVTGKRDDLKPESLDTKKESVELNSARDIIKNAISNAQSAQKAIGGKKDRSGISKQTQAIHDNLRLREAIRRIR